MTTEFIHISVDALLTHAEQLFAEHWDEIALNKRVMVLKPDEDRYRTMEANGMLLAIAAVVDGVVVGYSVNFTMNHLHYADLCVCSNDLLYIAKDHRQGGVGLRLMRATEDAARKRGAQMMLWHAKPNTALAEILPRQGYGVQDIIFSREI